MMKTKKLLVMVFTLLFMVLSLCSLTVYAAEPYTAIHGTTTKFNTYLVVSGDAHIPAASFTYTVAAGAGVPAGTGTLAVISGPNADLVTVGSEAKTVFTVDQGTTAGAVNDNVTNSTSKKYAKNEVTVNFENVTFSNPGVYRYVVTQSAATDTTGRIVNDDVSSRTIDVYVEDNAGALVLAGYVMYNGVKTDGPSATATTASGKSNQFVNAIATQNLSFGKTVTGNQGSKDKFFQFTVIIENAGAGTVLDVDMSYAKTAPAKTFATIYEAGVMKTANQITSLTADAAGKIEHSFYLSHNDIITITGLPKGTTYSVSEVKEDYSSSSPANASGSIADAAVNVIFTNTRGGVVPTGVIMTLIPGVVLVLFAGFGLFAVVRKKRTCN